LILEKEKNAVIYEMTIFNAFIHQFIVLITIDSLETVKMGKIIFHSCTVKTCRCLLKCSMFSYIFKSKLHHTIRQTKCIKK